jgi:hypothetical protein
VTPESFLNLFRNFLNVFKNHDTANRELNQEISEPVQFFSDGGSVRESSRDQAWLRMAGEFSVAQAMASA